MPGPNIVAAVTGERLRMRKKIKLSTFDDSGNRTGYELYRKAKPKDKGVNPLNIKSFGKDPKTGAERIYILTEEVKGNRRKKAMSSSDLKREGNYSKKTKSGKGKKYENPCKSDGASGNASESCGPNK